MKNVLLLALLFSFFSCRSQQASSSKLSAEEFEKGLANPDVQLLDVRTAGEFNTGHIKKALQANWVNHEEFTERVKYIDKNKPVYIYCLVGSRSSAAANWMKENGFKEVIELQGGINSWKRAAKSIEGGIKQQQMTLAEYNALIPGDKTVLVDFGAAWCPPCVKMRPVIEELEKSGSANFQLINVDAGVHTEIMKAMNIEPIPVFIIYKKGKEVWRKQGMVTKAEFIKELK
jgi:rhodanese-related sulfurtransferase